jgi:hypothetical protein
MLLTIFGAGASYDSVPRRDYTSNHVRHSDYLPPLAAELFQPRDLFSKELAEYRSASPLIQEIRNALAAGEPVEDILQRYQDLALAEGADGELPSQLLALQFYLRAIIDQSTWYWADWANGATNYAALFNQIERWRVTGNGEPVLVATFNYDRMVMSALSSRVDFGHVDRFIDGRNYKVFYLHGCVTWSHDVNDFPRNTTAQELIERANVLDRNAGFTTSSGELAQIPALAIPTTGKRGFECPERHVEHLTGLLSSVDRVLVIGWRAQEQHFLELFKQTPGGVKVLVANNGRAGAEEAARRLLAAQPEALVTPGPYNGFSDLMQDPATLQALLSGEFVGEPLSN